MRAAVLLLLLAAPFLLPSSWRERAASSLRDAFSPFYGTVARVGEAFSALRPGAGPEPTRSELLEEIGRLRHEVRRLESLEQENFVLRRQLGFRDSAPHRLIAAEVIARDLNTWWHTIRIARGAVDGLRPDMPVLTPEGLVGKTVSVSAYTADVRLMMDPESNVSACLRRLEAFGMVRGAGVSRGGSAQCNMTFLVKDIPVQQGEEVVTSGLSAIYPRGLLIGYVSRARADASGLFQIAEITPGADFNSLRTVYVVDWSDASNPERKGGQGR